MVWPSARASTHKIGRKAHKGSAILLSWLDDCHVLKLLMHLRSQLLAEGRAGLVNNPTGRRCDTRITACR